MTVPHSPSVITLFINLLAALAPTIWVILAGALGVGVGAYGRNKFMASKPTPTRRRKTAAKRPRRK